MRKRRAFTLIELLVVIAIIALLLGILMPSLNKVKKQAQNVICKTNLHNYQVAGVMYLNENGDAFPNAWQSLFDSCQGRSPCTKGNCKYPDSGHVAFIGETSRLCRWHNEDYDLTEHPDYAGPMWEYLASKDVHVCPTFKTFAMKYGQDHVSHDSSIEIGKDTIQFAYSQNALLGWAQDTENLAVMKSTKVKGPSQVFYYAEENCWETSGRNSAPLNDTALLVDYYSSSLDDTFASFHRTTYEKREEGVSNIVFVDGSMGEAGPDESLMYSRPK